MGQECNSIANTDSFATMQTTADGPPGIILPHIAATLRHMQTIGIETAQNVTLGHETASLGDRIVAYIIDTLIIYAWAILCVIIIFYAGLWDQVIGYVIIAILAILPAMFYHLVSELTMNGQSIGKRSRHIKVARMDGGHPRVSQYLLRWILRPIDSFYWVGLVVILVNGKGQRLGDLAAGTTVISLKPRMTFKDTLLTEVPEEHTVRFPEAIRLTDRQAAMIREVLKNVSVADRWALIDEMAEKVRGVIGNRGEGMRSMEFLEHVLRDHVHLTSGMGGSGAFGEQGANTP